MYGYKVLELWPFLTYIFIWIDRLVYYFIAFSFLPVICYFVYKFIAQTHNEYPNLVNDMTQRPSYKINIFHLI